MMSVSRLRKLDLSLFQLERTVVCLAALIMVTTVTLDISHRALLGAKSTGALALLGVFGLLEVPESQGWSPLGLLLCLAVALALGRAAMGAWDKQRGEEGSPLRWLLGAPLLLWGSSLILLHCPSWIVCALLAGGLAVSLSRAALARGRGAIASSALVVGGLLCWGSTQLPQDYIWSQELALLLLAYVAFLGGSMATYEGQHLKVEAFQRTSQLAH